MDKSEEEFDKEFGNWVKCCIALRYLKSGLLPFVENEVKQIHSSTLRSLKSKYCFELVHCVPCVTSSSCNHIVKLDCDTCTDKHCADKLKQHFGECTLAQCRQCTGIFCSECSTLAHVIKACDCTDTTILPNHSRRACLHAIHSKCNCNGKRAANARACKNKLCGHLYDAVLQIHVKGDPQFVNCDPRLWKNDHWEFAKCFVSSPGYAGKKCPDDLDAAALLSICINQKSIHSGLKRIKTFTEVSYSASVHVTIHTINCEKTSSKYTIYLYKYNTMCFFSFYLANIYQAFVSSSLIYLGYLFYRNINTKIIFHYLMIIL